MRPGQKEFLVWREDDEREDARVVEAYIHADAVEKWADDTDGYGDYTIVKGSPEKVYVALNEPGSEAELYEASGEYSRQYSAYLIEEEK